MTISSTDFMPIVSVSELPDEILKAIRASSDHPYRRYASVELVMRATEHPEKENDLMGCFLGYNTIPTITASSH